MHYFLVLSLNGKILIPAIAIDMHIRKINKVFILSYNVKFNATNCPVSGTKAILNETRV